MQAFRPLIAIASLMMALLGTQIHADTTHCTDFFAGQTIAVGSVCVSVDENNVQVDYLMTGGWTLSEAHAWVGDSLSSMPRNGGGNPQVGKFPMSASRLGELTSFSFTVPVSSLVINPDTVCEGAVYAAAHAVVSKASGGKKAQTESAWAGTDTINSKGSWSAYFTYGNDCGSGPADPEFPTDWLPVLPQGCFNVFAQGSTSFTQAGIAGPGSAGWIINRDSNDLHNASYPLTDNTVNYGELLLQASGDAIALGYIASGNWRVQSINAFIGTLGEFNNIRPETYGYSQVNVNSSFTFIVADNPGGIAEIVAHAVICDLAVVLSL